MDEMTAAAAPDGNAVRTDIGGPGGSLAGRRAEAQPYAVFLYIWGLEWFVSAAMLLFDPSNELVIWRQAALLIAVIVTAGLLLRRNRKGVGTLHENPRILVGAALPVMAAILVILVLRNNAMIDTLYMPLLKGIVLTAAYGALSLRLGRPLLYLSLWMLALTLTSAFAYLGYASVLLGAFGGLSLIALGFLFNLWNTLWKKENAAV